MNETLKVLDPKGVEYLWSKISMQDYPNNETLISVINAIDETKADKSELIQNADSLTDIDKTQIRNNIGVSGYNWREIKYTFTAYNFSNIVIVADIDGKDINNWNQILTIYDQTGRAELGGVTDYPAMLSVLMMLDFVLDPVAVDDNYRLNLCQNVIIPNLESLIHANVLSTDIWFAVNSGIGKIDHINIWTSDADTYNFIISESTYRPSTAYLSYKKSSNSFTYNTLKPDYGYTDTSLSIVNAAADAKAVGDALALKADIEDAKVVLVNLTPTEEECIYTADRNYEEVVEAIDAGRTVVAVLDGVRHNYLFEEGGELVFTANEADWMSAVFFSPDIVVVENFPIALADQIPTKVSQLENDSGFIISVPVSSVNGKTGAVQLTASDVGALPVDTVIPSVAGLATEEYVNNAVSQKSQVQIITWEADD